jgi:hypothetical protein
MPNGAGGVFGLFYPGGAAETFEAAREVINCCHITFAKGHCARNTHTNPLAGAAGPYPARHIGR